MASCTILNSALNNLEDINAIDTQGLVSTANEETNAQALIDEIATDVVGIQDGTVVAKKASQLETTRTFRTNLGSTSTASFNGTANVTPGVTGTLKVANGGTGATTADAARTALGALNKAGDTMTGDLTLKKTTTIESNAPSRLIFTVVQSDNNITSSGQIAVYDDHDAAANGTNMVIQSKGNMVIGSGESANTCYSTDLKNSSSENMYVTADSHMYFYSNANTYANKKVMTFNNAGALTVPNDTNYTTSKVRNIKASTTDLTAGTSTLASGAIYLVYE